jgi:hypothetical protein
MVHVQSNIDAACFREPSSELASYWFGYLKGRAYRFKNRARIRCRAPLSDIGHLFQLGRDVGTFRIPQKIDGGFGDYAQLIIDSKELCAKLDKYGWDHVPSELLSTRHVIRGLLDGCGSVSRNGQGIQAKYLRIAFYNKDAEILKWICQHLGPRKIAHGQVSWAGKRAIEIAKMLYLNQSRYLNRKFDKISNVVLV